MCGRTNTTSDRTFLLLCSLIYEMDTGWFVLCCSGIMHGRLAEGHRIAKHMVLRNPQSSFKLRQQVINDVFSQSVPDRADPKGLSI